MPRIVYQGLSHEAGSQSVLECLTARGHAIPNSCRAGLCQSCLMRATRGAVPLQAQQGLNSSLVARQFFLACQCFPPGDMEVALAEDSLDRFAAQVCAIVPLTRDIAAIHLQLPAGYRYRAGQFLRLFRDEHTWRNYSLASVPGLDSQLELQVQRVAGGLVSGWLLEHVRPGESLTVSEALGDCFYSCPDATQNLLLLGTGSGLAPLLGIARDALASGHRGRIALYHGGRTAAGLYREQELRALARLHENFRYHGCVAEDGGDNGTRTGTALELALLDLPDLAGWRVYLCGNPAMVEAARMQTFLAGASGSEIFADPFFSPEAQKK